MAKKKKDTFTAEDVKRIWNSNSSSQKATETVTSTSPSHIQTSKETYTAEDVKRIWNSSQSTSTRQQTYTPQRYTNNRQQAYTPQSFKAYLEQKKKNEQKTTPSYNQTRPFNQAFDGKLPEVPVKDFADNYKKTYSPQEVKSILRDYNAQNVLEKQQKNLNDAIQSGKITQEDLNAAFGDIDELRNSIKDEHVNVYNEMKKTDPEAAKEYISAPRNIMTEADERRAEIYKKLKDLGIDADIAEAYFNDQDVATKNYDNMTDAEKEQLKNEYESIQNYNVFERYLADGSIENKKEYNRKQELSNNYNKLKNDLTYDYLLKNGMTEDEMEALRQYYTYQSDSDRLAAEGYSNEEIEKIAQDRIDNYEATMAKIYDLFAGTDKFDDITQMIKERYANPQIERDAEEHAIEDSLFTLATNPFESTGAVLGNAYNFISGRPLQNYKTYTNIVRDTTSKNIDSRLGQIVYGGAMSIGDMAVAAAAAYGTGGGSIVSAGIQALEKAAEVINQGVDRGLTPEQIFAEGIGSGVTTFITEKIPMGKLSEIAEKGLTEYTAKEIGKTLASMMITEGAQEGFEDVADWAMDAVVSWDKNEFNEDVQAYIEQGYSKEEAVRKVIADRGIEMLTDVVIGGIGGGVMGGAGSTLAYTTGRIQPSPSIQTDIVLESDAALNQLIEAVQSIDATNLSEEFAQRVEHAKEVSQKPSDELTVEDVVDMSNVVNEQAGPDNNLAQTIQEINYQANYENNINEYLTTGKIEEKANELPIERQAREQAQLAVKDFNKAALEQQKQAERDFINELKSYKKNDWQSDAEVKANTEQRLDEASAYFENDTAAKNFKDNYNGQSLDLYTEVSYLAYTAGESGQSFDTFLKNSAEANLMIKHGGVDKGYLKTLFYNGQNARTANNEEVTLRKNENRGKATNLSPDDQLATLKKAIAKKLNIEVATNFEDAESRGNFMASVARLVTNSTSDNEYATIIHEMFEFARSYNAKGMELVDRTLTDMIVKKKGERSFVDAVNRYKETYRRAGKNAPEGSSLKSEANKTFSEAQEEFVNDAASYIFSTEEGMKTLVDYIMDDGSTTAQEKMSAIQTIKAWVDDLIRAIKNFLSGHPTDQLGYKYAERLKLTSAELQNISQMLVGALEGARANLEAMTEQEGGESEKEAHSIDVKEESVQDRINASMTMDQCRDMLKRAFISGDIKDYYEGEVKNADEWLEQDGAEIVALTAENDQDIYFKFLSNIEGLDEDFTVEDIIKAYQAGTLTGKNVAKKETKRLDISKKGKTGDSRFYSPKEIEDYKNLYEVANQKVTKSNREEITKARAAILLFAHNKGAAELLGITNTDLNKALRKWGNYSATARDISMRINAGASVENRWTGIENMAWLNRVSVSDAELDNICGDIKGDSSESQRAYIVRTMLALDTHIDYKGLNFVFTTKPDENRASVYGLYSNDNRTITVKYGVPNTIAHEIGHYLDSQWGREVTKGSRDTYLTDLINIDRSYGSEEVDTWIQNFKNFIDSIEDSSNFYNSYTMERKEVFARFVARFVIWADKIANGSSAFTEDHFNDKFTQAQFIEFARLLQEKSSLNLENVDNKARHSLAVTDNSVNEAFSIAEDGRLVLVDPEKLTDNDWKIFYKEFKKLGYDFDSVEDCKERMTWFSNNSKKYGRIGDTLRQDQSDALKKAFGIGDTQEETRNEAQYKENAKKAEKHFGTTSSFKLAGYLDINGKLLDFSEGQGYRVQDHREISEVLDLPEDADYSDGLIEFMNEGNIRLQTYGIDIAVAPNKQQKSVLRDFFNSLNGEVVVDYSRPDGSTAGSTEYSEKTASSRILNDIDSYFETGEVPEGNVRYSIDVKFDDELKSYGEYNLNDYISVQKAVLPVLREEGFFDEDKKEIKNQKNNKVIVITPKAIKETLGKGKRFETLPRELREIKVATLRSLPEIIKEGTLTKDNADNIHDDNSEKFDYYSTPIKISGVVDAVVRFAVKKGYRDKFWIHHIDVEKGYKKNLESLNLSTKNEEPNEANQDSSDIVTDKSEKSRKSLAVHAGDLGKAEGFWQMTSSNRGTGHFGTGTYFVGDEEQINNYGYEKRPHEKVDFDNYHLFKPKSYKEALNLHEALKFINNNVYSYDILNRLDSLDYDLGYIDKYGYDLFKEENVEKATKELNRLYDIYGKYMDRYDRNRLGSREDYKDEADFLTNFSDYTDSIREGVEDYVEKYEDNVKKLADALGISEDTVKETMLEVFEECAKIENAYAARYEDSPSTRFMKALGYEGVDVRDIKQMDNVEYGSVIYDLKGEDLKRKQEIGTAKYSLKVTEDSEGRELSEGQQKYFKNSKIVDENGRLKVMYHGSMFAGFTVFNPEASDDKISLFFSDNPEVSRTYTNTLKRFNPDSKWTFETLKDFVYSYSNKNAEAFEENGKIEIENYRTGHTKTFNSVAEAQKYFVDEYLTDSDNDTDRRGIYEVYLNAENPLIVDADGEYWNSLPPVEFPARHLYDVDIQQTSEGTEISYEENGVVKRDSSANYKTKDGYIDIDAFYNKYGIDIDEQTKLAEHDYLYIDDIFLSKDGERVEEYGKTRDYTKYAKEHGYDSVIFKNIIDYGKYGKDADENVTSDVVVVFNSNQVKSIYNENPTKNEDIRYSIDVSGDGFFDSFLEIDEEVKKTESALKEMIEKRMDLDSDISKKMISDVASYIRNKYNSTYKKEWLESSITAIFKFLQNNNVRMEDIMYIMSDIAKPILENVKNADPEQEKLYKDVVNTVKSYKIKLDAGQRQEVINAYGSYKNFVDSMRGKITLSNDGIALDNIWTELVDKTGGSLSYGTVPNDQPIELANLINGLNPTYASLEGQALEDAAMDVALDIISQFYVHNSMTDAAKAVKGELTKRANKFKEEYKKRYNEALKQVEAEKALNIKRLADEIDNLTAEEQEAIRTGDTVNQVLIENLRKEYKARYERLQAQANEKIARARANYQNNWINKNLRRERSELKNRVLREVKALQNIIAHPQEGASKHVPINLIKPTIEMLEAINLDNGGRNKAIADRLKKMSEVYESFKNDETYSFDYDERIASDIKELQEMFNNKSYADLGITELQRVIEIVTALKTQIKNANNLILQGKLQDAKAAADNAINEVKGSRRLDNAAMNALNRYGNIHLNAYREFRKLSGYQDGALMDIYNDLDEGSKREMQIQKDLGAIFQDVLEGQKNQKEVKKFISTKDEDLVDIGITDKNGKPIKITRAMRMSLIMHSMNAGNMRHVLGSGITIPNMYYFSKGKLDEAYAKGTNYRFVDYAQLLEAIQRNDQNKINELTTKAQERIEDMKKDLSEWEKNFLKDAEKMFHDETGKLINETSMKLKGYALARVKNYFPIKTDAHFTNQEWSGLVRDGSLEGMGMLKERVISTKPILLEDITNVIQRQIRNVSKYAGYAVPTRNFETIMKQTSRNQTDGQLHNLSETIDSVWGSSDTKYLKNLMQDIQGGRSEKGNFLMNLRGQFAGATLTLNPSVAIKQAASYPTAAAVVGWKALGRAVADVRKGFITQQGLEELEKINPLLWYRNQGNATQELADAKAVGFGKNLPLWMQKAVNWTQWFDTGTVRTLEYASMYYVDENYKNLKKGSEEYWQKVSEVFTNVVEQTQPNYSTLHKADIIRNPNSFVKMLVMFKTQPMQNFGIIYDAMGELNAAKISGNKQWVNEASSKAALAVTSQAVSATVFSAMTILSQLLLHRWWKYRDDDEKWSWEKFWLALGEGALSCLTGAFIGGSEIYEALKHIFTGSSYYGIEVSVAEMVNDFVENTRNLTKSANDLWEAKTTENREKSAQKILKSSLNLGATIGEFEGTPVNNIKNMLSAMYFYATDIIRSIDNGELSISNDSNIATWDIKNQYERIYEALQNGDTEKYNKLVQELKDDAADGETSDEEIAAAVEKKVTDKILSLMKADYLEGNISEEELSSFLQEEKGKTEDEAYFQIRKWETGETSDYGPMRDLISTAAEDPSSENRKAMIEEINNLLEHGKDKSKIASDITKNYKDEYITLYNEGKAADLNSILRAALVAAGYTDEEAKKKLEEWLK